VLPYRSTEDRIEGVVITFIDIDSRKKSEEALRASEQRLRKMANVDAVGILIFDRSGVLVDCNEAFLKMSGYSRQEVASCKLKRLEMTPPEYLAVTGQQLQRLEETGRIGPYEKEFIRKDGTRSWVIFAGASLGDGAVVEYCVDVSDRKRAEAQVVQGARNLRIADEALVRLNGDLKHFSYAVSHDMQEPLRMVMSFTQLLARDYRGKLDPEADRYIGFAVEGARRMENLLSNLREYWSVDEQKVEELVAVDCHQVLGRAIEHLETAIQESGASITHDPLPTVLAESHPLTLLFQNLIGNAIKYRRPDTPARIHVSSEPNERGWTLSVSDNGIGIEPEYHEVIFAPFKRLHSGEHPGTGLGLAMCQRIVERFQGRIWVQSKPEEGATFRFTLPGLNGAK
jgi:PAS domain S-box-containing protein